MNDQELFIKVIKKAEENGYKDHLRMLPVLPITKSCADLLVQKILWQRRYEIIFSHSFAKALWKQEKSIYNGVCDCSCYSIYSYTWQHKLKEMVLSEDPIKYLLMFIES